MSLEAKIEALTAAVIHLTQVMQAAQNTSAPAPVAAPTPAPVVAAPVMPALPTFAATPPAPAVAPVVAAQAAPAVACPFSDTQGLIAYTMGAYQAMGPEKGAKIQGVLQQLGYANINDVKPEHFGSFYQGVEALKA